MKTTTVFTVFVLLDFFCMSLAASLYNKAALKNAVLSRVRRQSPLGVPLLEGLFSSAIPTGDDTLAIYSAMDEVLNQVQNSVSRNAQDSQNEVEAQNRETAANGINTLRALMAMMMQLALEQPNQNQGERSNRRRS